MSCDNSTFSYLLFGFLIAAGFAATYWASTDDSPSAISITAQGQRFSEASTVLLTYYARPRWLPDQYPPVMAGITIDSRRYLFENTGHIRVEREQAAMVGAMVERVCLLERNTEREDRLWLRVELISDQGRAKSRTYEIWSRAAAHRLITAVSHAVTLNLDIEQIYPRPEKSGSR